MTPAAWGVPTASERGDRIRGGPQVGKVATSPLPPRGSPPLQSGVTESEVAHKWAKWLHDPCRLGGPHRFRAGGQNQRWPTSGQGGYITPAASGGPHRFIAGGQNQKWPTSRVGTIQYVYRSVSIPYSTPVSCMVSPSPNEDPVGTTKCPRNPWFYDISELIPTTKLLSQKHQKISTNICYHRPAFKCFSKHPA